LVRQDKWDGETIEPELKYHIGEHDEKWKWSEEYWY
jgi:hypothetical protein